MNEIKTLYSDSSKTNAIFPRTKFNAVTDSEGNPLGSIATPYTATQDCYLTMSLRGYSTNEYYFYLNGHQVARNGMADSGYTSYVIPLKKRSSINLNKYRSRMRYRYSKLYNIWYQILKGENNINGKEN